MSKFSEESLLLIRNWDAYKDILKAGERIKLEVSSVRNDMERRLRKLKWWNNNFAIVNTDNTQLAISDSRWEIDDGHLIWVGVEGLTLEGLFGNEPAPSMYVWIDGKRPDLRSKLQQVVSAGGKTELGELSQGQNMYVVEKSIGKCLPEQIDMLEDVLFSSFAEFCEHYTRYFDQFDKAAQKHLKAGK